MNTIVALLAILAVTGIGFLVIRGFNLLPRRNSLITLACSYGLGIGLLSAQMYIYTRFGIPWFKEFLFYPWILLLIYLFLRREKDTIIYIPKLPQLTLIDISLVFGIFLAFFYTVFQALIRPVSAWDAWVTWLLKSKVFFIDGKIDPDVLSYVMVNYPLVINLLGTFVYIMIGTVDDTSVLLTSSAFYFFTALLLFAVLKERFSTRYALLFTFLLVTTQNFVRHGGRYEAGLADLPLGYFAFCSTIILFEYLKKGSTKAFIMLNIFLGIMGLIKFEGIPIAIIIELFALIYIYKQKLFKQLPILLLWIIPSIDWEIYQRIYHLGDTYAAAHSLTFSFTKATNAFIVTLKELVNIKSWNLLWIIYFYTLFVFKIKKSKELVILNSVILSQLGIYMFMYIFTTNNSPEGSIERLLMHLAPLVYFYIAIKLKQEFPNKQNV